MKIESAEAALRQAKRRKRRPRTEDYDITFTGRLAEGWAFDVCEAHRAALDITYDTRVDQKRSTKDRKVYRRVWTRGNPPVRRFERGHVFYDPPGMRFLSWTRELAVQLRQSIQVLDASPDQEDGTEGWVVFEARRYENGCPVWRMTKKVSQAVFEEVLRSGVLPEA
jgi:hypothetical protein